MTETLLYQRKCKNTWALTTAVAMRTERIKIGSVGTTPYTFDPSEIATYIATLGLRPGTALAWPDRSPPRTATST